MTKQEVKDIITTKAAAHGFKTEESSFSELPQIARTMESYIGFQIFVTPNHDKTDYEKKIYCMDVEVKASVCHMNPNSTPEELLEASEEIKRGALLAKELQEMHLSYIHEI